MDPLRLTRFFDGPMARSQATVSRLQQEYGFVEDAPYEPQSQSRPFAKFEEGKARVVNMEETAVGGIFGRPATQVTVVPTREEEEILHGFAARAVASRRSRRRLKSASGLRVVTGDSANRPGSSSSALRGTVRTLAPNQFRTGHVRQPIVTEEKVQAVREGVMLPSQRRQQIEQEVRVQRAARLARKARNDRRRMIDLMRSRHPAGVVGMDSPVAKNTLAYADLGKSHRDLSRTKSLKLQQRAEFLATRRSPRKMRNYDFLVHNPAAPGPEEKTGKIFTGKGRAGVVEDSYKKMFEAPPKAPDNVKRRVHIRNNVSQGRRYDIVTGADLQYFPPNRPENKHVRLGHPSLISSGFPINR